MRKAFALWWRAVRAEFFTASIVPVAVGVSTAANRGHRSLLLAAVTLIGVLLLHAASNLANDYFDDLNGSDRCGPKSTPYSGGSRVIQDGLLTREQVRTGAVVCLIAGCLVGTGLAVVCGWPVIVLGLLGVLGGYLYSAPPVWLASRGLGEVTAGICFGPLIVLGTHFVIARRLDSLPIAASLPVGCLIAAVLYLNEFPDCKPDSLVGKRTLVVRLKGSRSRRGYGLLVILAYLSIAVGTFLKALPPWVLLCLLTLPLGWRAWTNLTKGADSQADLARACARNIANHSLTGMLLSVTLWLDKL